MMEGIAVLNTTEKFISGPGWSLACTTIAIFLGISILGVIISILTKDNVNAVLFTGMTIVIGLILLLSTQTADDKASSYIVYDVVIDESVSLREFNEKYEILDQKGEIFSIREKEVK